MVCVSEDKMHVGLREGRPLRECVALGLVDEREMGATRGSKVKQIGLTKPAINGPLIGYQN